MALIQVKDLTFGYDGNPDNVFEHVTFQMDTNWKLGFIGRNGRGKTTFCACFWGSTRTGGRSPARSPWRISRSRSRIRSRTPRLWWKRSRRSMNCGGYSGNCPCCRVDAEVLDRPFCTLSNGEQTKVLLAALFLDEDRFLLIDEPTNHLDEEARDAVCRYLNGKKGFILVSHDRTLLDGCVDHILALNRADIEVQAGNFRSWQENRNRQDQFERAEQAKLKKETARLAQAARRTADWSDRTEKGKFDTRNSGIRRTAAMWAIRRPR